MKNKIDIQKIIEGEQIIEKGARDMSSIVYIGFAFFLAFFIKLEIALLIVFGVLILSFIIDTYSYIKWLKTLKSKK